MPYILYMDIKPDQIEFDPNKDAINKEKHGISLAFGFVVLNNLQVEIEDDRKDYQEKRMIAFGLISNRSFCCVYTKRGKNYRIISLRKTNKKEMKKWSL